MSLPAGVGADKPICPDHTETMEYDPATDVWICPHFSCERKARPRVTIDGVSGQVIRPKVGLYAMKQEDGATRYFLYLKQMDVFIEITEQINPDTCGSMHGNRDGYHIGMNFEDGLHTGG
jgi:hypothetical protein